MFKNAFYSPAVAATANWLGIGTVIFGLLVWLTPDWFKNMTFPKIVLIAFGLSLGSLLIAAVSSVLIAIAFRRIRPLPVGGGQIDPVPLPATQLLAAVETPIPPFDPRSLSQIERDHLSAVMLEARQFLATDVTGFIDGIRHLLNWQKAMTNDGPAALRIAIEAPIPTLFPFADRIDQFRQRHHADLTLAGMPYLLNGIDQQVRNLRNHLLQVSSVADVMSEEHRNPTPLALPGQALTVAIAQLDNSVTNAISEVNRWRMRNAGQDA